MENNDIFEKDRKYIAHTYNRFPAAIITSMEHRQKIMRGKSI